MTQREFARECFRLIREALYVNDGSTKPCIGGVLNPLWVQARSANAAVAIADLFESEGRALAEAVTERGAVVHGEIETAEQHAERVIK